MKKITKILALLIALASFSGCAQVSTMDLENTNAINSNAINTNEINTNEINTNEIKEVPYVVKIGKDKIEMKSNIIPDKNVKLISPPNKLPNNIYILPNIEEKEIYIPPKKIIKKCKKCKVVLNNKIIKK